jgi:hypothetical protein
VPKIRRELSAPAQDHDAKPVLTGLKQTGSSTIDTVHDLKVR